MRKKKRVNQLDKFIEDFAVELDMFDSTLGVPEWTFDYREALLRKLSPELRKICRALKEYRLTFKIMYPIEINSKWKFADLYFPKHRTVLIVSNPMSNFRPAGLQSDRAEFFADRFRVVEVETLAELEQKMRLKAERTNRIEPKTYNQLCQR